jgi:hypothetical protein
MRFLHLIRPVMCVLPEVSTPDRKVSYVVDALSHCSQVELKCLCAAHFISRTLRIS